MSPAGGSRAAAASWTRMPVVRGEAPGSRLRSTTRTRRPRAAAACAQASPAKLAPAMMRSCSCGIWLLRPARRAVYFVVQSKSSRPSTPRKGRRALRRALHRQLHPEFTDFGACGPWGCRRDLPETTLRARVTVTVDIAEARMQHGAGELVELRQVLI